MNELTVLLAAYHLLVFNDWVLDEVTQKYTGYSLLGMVAIVVSLNTALMLVLTIKDCILKCKRRIAKNIAKKKMEALRDSLRIKQE